MSSGSVRSVFIYQRVPGYEEEHQRGVLSRPRWKSWPWRIGATAAAGLCARSLAVRQTQISATTSPTGGLLPLPCLLSCFGFVSTYRSPHLCSLSVFSLVFCLVSFLASVCSFISSFICLWENTTAASEGPRAGGSRVEVRLHEEVSHLPLSAVMMALSCAVALLARTRPSSQFGPRAFAGTLLCHALCLIP